MKMNEIKKENLVATLNHPAYVDVNHAEHRLIFESWSCRFCGRSYGEKALALDHARDCCDNPDNRTCSTCAHYDVLPDGERYLHHCGADATRKDEYRTQCEDWEEA